MVRITVIYGKGRGKTTSAIGYSYLQEIENKKITIAQFLKTGKNCGECYFFENHRNIRWFFLGKDEFFTGENRGEYINIIEEGLHSLFESLKEEHTNLLILDELGMALEFELIGFSKIKKLYSFVTEEIIITGRIASLKILEEAHKQIQIEEKKHPYNKGISARIGIDY